MTNDDPFQPRRVVIKVLDVKGGYIKYYYMGEKSGPDGWTSNSVGIMKHIFREIQCEGE